jgi:hypothetical protein
MATGPSNAMPLEPAVKAAHIQLTLVEQELEKCEKVMKMSRLRLLIFKGSKEHCQVLKNSLKAQFMLWLNQCQCVY